MENEFFNGLRFILRGILFPRRCLRRRFKPLAFSAAPTLQQPLWVQTFFVHIFRCTLYLVYGNVLCMIQTLINIYSCNTVKVTKKTSR